MPDPARYGPTATSRQADDDTQRYERFKAARAIVDRMITDEVAGVAAYPLNAEDAQALALSWLDQCTESIELVTEINDLLDQYSQIRSG